MASNFNHVAELSDLLVGHLLEVEVSGKKVLLANVDGQVFATSAECPHYGVSLAEGLLCGNRVVCAWHKAVFDVTDGALLEPPAFDGLASYKTKVENGQIFVEEPDEEHTHNGLAEPGQTREVPLSFDAASGGLCAFEKPAIAAPRTGDDKRCFVLAGAGAAAVAAADTLRARGYAGRLVMISEEKDLPYDRTMLTKEFLSDKATREDLSLRPAEFWERQGIERTLNRVANLNTAEKKVSLSDGSSLEYDQLLIATGAEPRRIKIRGAELGDIFTVRSASDAEAVLKATKPGVRVAVIGGSFIAMEVASCLATRSIPVTVIISEERPFAKRLGVQVGQVLQRLHESHGVVFELAAEVDCFEGSGVVSHVKLKSGVTIPADVVIVGIGVEPATTFADSLRRSEDGGIRVDGQLKAASHVYAAGDIAVFPETYSNTTARIEHWRVALQHGRTAAANMLGAESNFEGVPYFWTNHFDTRFDYLGHAEAWDEIIFREESDFPTYIAFYLVDGRVAAASACQRDHEIAALHELFRLRYFPTVAEIRGGTDLVALAQKLASKKQEPEP